MNKFIFRRTAVLLSIFFIVVRYHASAQTVQYLPPFDFLFGSESYYQLAGKVENNFLLYYNEPASLPSILSFSEDGSLINTAKLDFINPGKTSTVAMVSFPDRLNLVMQEFRNDKLYTIVASLSSMGKLLNTPKIIDSAAIDLYGSAAFSKVISSPNKKYSLLYRIVSGFSSSQILFTGILLSEEGLVKGSTSFYIPFNEELEQPGTVFINNNGTVFLPVFDKYSNYRVGTTLRIYQTGMTSKAPQLTELYLKENKPTELLLDWYEHKKQLVLSGLYHNFYSKRIEGAMAIYLSENKAIPDTVVYIPMEKGFKKELKDHIYNTTMKDAINGLQVRYCKINEDGGLMLLTNMFTNSGLNQKWASPNLPMETPAPTAFRQSRRQSSNSQNPQSSLNSYRTISAGSQPRFNNQDRSATGTNRTRSAQDIVNQQQLNQSQLQNSTDRLSQPIPLPNTMETKDLVSMNKTLDYKSVVFTIDSSKTVTSKTWIHNLFIPGTPFSNIIIIPVSNTIGLLNYELNNKNKPYLISHIFQTNDKPRTVPIGNAGIPMLFHKKNAVLINDHELLTLYSNENETKIGLAIVRW